MDIEHFKNTFQFSEEADVPLYIQLAAYLRIQIHTGVLQPGEMMIAENSLCDILNISRTTVRQSMNQLVEEGLLVRYRGKGTFIANSKIKRNMNHLYNFTENMKAIGAKPSSKVIKAEVLEIRPNDRIKYFDWLEKEDLLVQNTEANYVPAAAVIRRWRALRNLECMIFKFENFEDCSPIGKGFPYWPGVGFEASLYGAEQKFTEEDSWSSREPLLNGRIDLNTLQLGDFYNSPVMKVTHDFYNKMREILSNDFSVTFPQWCRSPFGVAWPLRGVEALIIDFCDDRDGVEDLIKKITDDRILWSKRRAKYLGTELMPVSFYNDEVTNPVVSPAMYNDVIFDSEVAISNAFGGLSYWHSCGNTTVFIPKINEIPNVQMVHVSPWTDIAAAVRGYSNAKALEIALHPVEDVLYPKDENMPKIKLEEIKKLTSMHRSTVRADGFAIISDRDKEIKRVQEWAKMAKTILLV